MTFRDGAERWLCRRRDVAGGRGGTTFESHRDFPHLPPSAPLTFLLTMQACLSAVPEDRPTFEQVRSRPGSLSARVPASEPQTDMRIVALRALSTKINIS